MSDPQLVPRKVALAEVAVPRAILPVLPPVDLPGGSRPQWQGTHRLRLHALIRRLSVIGAIGGGLLFIVLLCLMLDPADLMDARWGGGWAEIGGIMGILAAAAFLMSGMLLFYSLRARAIFNQLSPAYVPGMEPHVPAQRTKRRREPMPFLKSDLNKIRLMAAPLLLTLLLMLSMDLEASSSSNRPDLTPLWLVAAYLGCCAQLIVVRRAAWEIARIEGVPFDASEARGFAVPKAAPVRTSGVVTPGAVPAAPLVVVSPVPVMPLEAPAGAIEPSNAFSDWETMLHSMAVLGLGIYVVWLCWWFEAGISFLRMANMFAPTYSAFSAGEVLWGLMQLFTGALALGWVIWGVTCLSFGPRFRAAVLTLAWASLGMCAIGLFLSLYRSDAPSTVTNGYLPGSPTIAPQGDRVGSFHSVMTSALFPAVVLVLLRRPPVKELFAHRPRRRRAMRTG